MYAHTSIFEDPWDADAKACASELHAEFGRIRDTVSLLASDYAPEGEDPVAALAAFLAARKLRAVTDLPCDHLSVALILLGSAVAVVVLFRRLSMPAILGYLLVGAAIGPGALGIVSASAEERYLAEFGVVFLMFSVGLEFSLPQLMAMRRTVFGYGGAQVALVMALAAAVALAAGESWKTGLIVRRAGRPDPSRRAHGGRTAGAGPAGTAGHEPTGSGLRLPGHLSPAGDPDPAGARRADAGQGHPERPAGCREGHRERHQEGCRSG